MFHEPNGNLDVERGPVTSLASNDRGDLGKRFDLYNGQHLAIRKTQTQRERGTHASLPLHKGGI